MKKYFCDIPEVFLSLILILISPCQVLGSILSGEPHISALAPPQQSAVFRDVANQIGLAGIVNKVLTRHGIDTLRLLAQRWTQVSDDLRMEIPDRTEFKIGIFSDCVYIIKSKFLLRYTVKKDIKDDLYISALEPYDKDPNVKLYDEKVELGGKDFYLQIYAITPDIEEYIRLAKGFLPEDLRDISGSQNGLDRHSKRVSQLVEEWDLPFTDDELLDIEKRYAKFLDGTQTGTRVKEKREECIDFQKTIKPEDGVTFTGLGFHSGKKLSMGLKPAPPGTGIVFVRKDLVGEPKIKATYKNVSQHFKSVCLEENNVRVISPEHLLAALGVLGIDNVFVELEGEEVPILDGGTLCYYLLEAHKDELIKIQDEKRQLPKTLDKPVIYSKPYENGIVIALPDFESEGVKITSIIDFRENNEIGAQSATVSITPVDFWNVLAFARTFIVEDTNLDDLRQAGFLLGAIHDITATFVPSDKVEDPDRLRRKDEPALHKIVDFFGDMQLLGSRLKGVHFIAIETGHTDHKDFLRKLSSYFENNKNPAYDSENIRRSIDRIRYLYNARKAMPQDIYESVLSVLEKRKGEEAERQDIITVPRESITEARRRFVSGEITARGYGVLKRSMGTEPFIFIGGVLLSRECLIGMCKKGHIPDIVFCYKKEKYGYLSGFAHFDDLAQIYGFKLIEVSDINARQIVNLLTDLQPEAAIIGGWSQLIKERVLKTTKYWINIHPSILPLNRGNAPIPNTFFDLGDKLEGKGAVSMIEVVPGEPDSGPIIDQIEFNITRDDDARSIYALVARLHREIIERNIDKLLNVDKRKDLVFGENDERIRTIKKMRYMGDGLIDWSLSANAVYNFIRAITKPYPGAFSNYGDRRLFIWKVGLAGDLKLPFQTPGTIVRCKGKTYVAVKDGFLELLKISWEGNVGESPVELEQGVILNSGISLLMDIEASLAETSLTRKFHRLRMIVKNLPKIKNTDPQLTGKIFISVIDIIQDIYARYPEHKLYLILPDLAKTCTILYDDKEFIKDKIGSLLSGVSESMKEFSSERPKITGYCRIALAYTYFDCEKACELLGYAITELNDIRNYRYADEADLIDEVFNSINMICEICRLLPAYSAREALGKLEVIIEMMDFLNQSQHESISYIIGKTKEYITTRGEDISHVKDIVNLWQAGVRDGEISDGQPIGAAEGYHKYRKIDKDMLKKIIDRLILEYGPGLFAVVDAIRVADNLRVSGPKFQVTSNIVPYSMIVKEDGKNILLVDVDAFDSEELLYVVLEHGLKESIMNIIPSENNAVRELTANYMSLKSALERGIKIGKDKLEELGADLQFFEVLEILQTMRRAGEEITDEKIIAVAIEYMRGTPYYAELFKEFPFAEDWRAAIGEIEETKARYEAAIRVFNEIMAARKGLDRTVGELNINIRVMDTFTGRRRVVGLEGLPRRLQEMICAITKQINNLRGFEGRLVKADSNKYILADSNRLKKLEEIIGRDEFERIRKNFNDNNYLICTKIPDGVELENIIRLVDPADVKNMRQISGMLYLPMPYTRSSFYMAADILIARGEIDIINPLIKELIKGLYKELDDNDLKILFTHPWELLPKIRSVLDNMDNLRRAIEQIEKAA